MSLWSASLIPFRNKTVHSCIKIGKTIVFTDIKNDQLLIYNSRGTGLHGIVLSFSPLYIAEIDSNTVAVSDHDRNIHIMKLSTGSDISSIQPWGFCSGISYTNKSLYVLSQGIIFVMDLTGKVSSSIHLSIDIEDSDDIRNITVNRDRFICTDKTSIYCFSLEGKLMWKFKNPKYEYLRKVTTDDEGNIYATNIVTNAVIVVSGDGKS